MAKAKTQTRKKLTNAQKKFNKEVREELRAKGIMPPVKPKLNRKKFAEEVIPEFIENLEGFDDIRYLYEAIRWMKPNLTINKTITPEQVGVLKLMKLALEIKYFNKRLRDAGEKEYKLMDLYNEVVQPIINL